MSKNIYYPFAGSRQNLLYLYLSEAPELTSLAAPPFERESFELDFGMVATSCSDSVLECIDIRKKRNFEEITQPLCFLAFAPGAAAALRTETARFGSVRQRKLAVRATSSYRGGSPRRLLGR